MDATIRTLERRVAADPEDDGAASRLARELARVGRSVDARAVARSRFAARRMDAESASLVLELAPDAIDAPSDQGFARTNAEYRVERAGSRPQGLVEIVPTVGFAGLPGAGARENALVLRDLLGAQDLLISQADDESIIDFTVPLARPWVLARAFTARSIRIVTIPVAPHLTKLRRQKLRATNALAFVVDARADGDGPRSNELAFKALARDFRSVHVGFALEELPLVLQYVEPVEDAWRRALAVALGVGRVARAEARIDTGGPVPDAPSPRFARMGDDERPIAHEGVVETLAYLLAGIASGVRGLAAPRPRFVRAR